MSVSTFLMEDFIQLSVQDFGIGIAPVYHINTFRQFNRSNNEIDYFPWMGFGLHISAEIIKLYEGQILVESEPGKGATFIFGLPVVPA